MKSSQSIRKVTIYYFSGTGNARNIAGWFKATAITNTIDCQIINISDLKGKQISYPETDALIVFISPVHGFNYPPVMLRFMARFPKGNNRVVLMNTRAGMLIGKFITPGLSGIAFYLAAIILLLKGYHIKGMVPFDMPSNWLSLHPSLNDRTVLYLHERNRIKANRVAMRCISGKRCFRGLADLIQDLLIAPISAGYYFAGRFFLAKTFYASSACDNCNACINGCPVNAIKTHGGRPFWTYNCESCMKCMNHCHKTAIETGHGYIAVFSLILSLIFPVLAHFIFDNAKALPYQGAILFTIESALMVFLMAFWYRIIHYLLRYKWFNTLIKATSLTSYQFWGKRYKALKSDF